MFSQLHKEHSKYCKILRKQRITDALEEAEQAAQRHDTWALYRIVRRLAPKVPSKKFQIQQKGKLLSPQEELQTMVKYYEELYAVSQVTTTKYSGTLSDDFWLLRRSFFTIYNRSRSARRSLGDRCQGSSIVYVHKPWPLLFAS